MSRSSRTHVARTICLLSRAAAGLPCRAFTRRLSLKIRKAYVSISGVQLLFHAVAESDLDRVLSVPVSEPLWRVTADEYRRELAKRQYRPEWTWVAEDEGRVLARAVWWGQVDSTHPLALDCLLTDDTVTDRAELACELLAAAHRAFLDAGARQLPDYNILKLPGGWRDTPATAA